jgi:hypothetical protein
MLKTRGSSIFLNVFAEHMTKLLNGDDDGRKVRAAERASGRFIGSCANSIYSDLLTLLNLYFLKLFLFILPDEEYYAKFNLQNS